MSEKKLPQHITVIMDGNGRWAKNQALPRVAGHAAGYESVRRVIRCCVDKKIPVLTLFAFSSENWNRPEEEVSYLLELFSHLLDHEIQTLKENNIQFHVIGDASRFSPLLCEKIENAQRMTAENSGLKLVIAANYGGRWDITQAARKIAEDVKNKKLSIDALTEEQFQSYLSGQNFPEPDLLIRTSGEQRLSNFLIWQLAYAELFFTSVAWPDFNEDTFNEALSFFASRQRRFGYTSEQVERMESD